jgi:hypothetical protein
MAITVEYLYIFILSIGYINITQTVCSYSAGMGEIARPISLPAKGKEKFATACENLNAII